LKLPTFHIDIEPLILPGEDQYQNVNSEKDVLQILDLEKESTKKKEIKKLEKLNISEEKKEILSDYEDDQDNQKEEEEEEKKEEEEVLLMKQKKMKRLLPQNLREKLI
jgi:hypothetical protein